MFLTVVHCLLRELKSRSLASHFLNFLEFTCVLRPLFRGTNAFFVVVVERAVFNMGESSLESSVFNR